jgi:hypothetical protein
VVPHKEIEDLISPVYTNAGKCGRSYELSAIVQFNFMWRSCRFSDSALEEALHEIVTACRFSSFSPVKKSASNETTIPNSRNSCESNELSCWIIAAISSFLAIRGPRLAKETIVDVSIIAAPRSIKYASGTRIPKKQNN